MIIILFFLRKSKIQVLFFFFFMYPKSRQNKKGKWQMIPFSWEKTYFDKISSFYGLRVLTPTYVNHNQAPWCGPHLQVFLNLTQRNLHLRHIESWPQETQKKKKNKNQKEKTRKRKEGRLTTSPQGAHCPEQPPPFTLTPTHPLFLLLPLSKFFDQNSRERKVKIK